MHQMVPVTFFLIHCWSKLELDVIVAFDVGRTLLNTDLMGRWILEGRTRERAWDRDWPGLVSPVYLALGKTQNAW